MARRYTAVLTALALVFVSLTPAYAARRNQCSEGLVIPVQATSLDQGSFVGQLEITRFAREADSVVAVGLLTGTLTDEMGAVTGIVRTVKLPVDFTNLASAATAAAAGGITIQQTCDVLHLTLGPLHLDLLGLIIDLNQVQLDITADPAGGLLGSLLCALAGLLGGAGPIPGLLNQIVGLLNQILAALG
jgi:hypothetical protein